MEPEHFYQYKEYFTQEEAAKLIKDIKEGGAMDKAIVKAMKEALAVDEDDDAEDEEEDGEGSAECESEGEEEADEDGWGKPIPWKSS